MNDCIECVCVQIYVHIYVCISVSVLIENERIYIQLPTVLPLLIRVSLGEE